MSVSASRDVIEKSMEHANKPSCFEDVPQDESEEELIPADALHEPNSMNNATTTATPGSNMLPILVATAIASSETPTNSVSAAQVAIEGLNRGVSFDRRTQGQSQVQDQVDPRGDQESFEEGRSHIAGEAGGRGCLTRT